MTTHFVFPDSVPVQLIPQEKKINELRKAQGLPVKRTLSLKTDNLIQYFANPDQAEVTGIRTQRSFTYLNLNGGDSWAYWHPEENFEFIYNFKGEPIYRTSELVPAYYIARLRQKRALLTGVRSYYVFRDPRADVYYAGWYDSNTQEHQFNLVSTKAKLTDFMAQYALAPLKVIPDWTCTFNPQSILQVDPKTQYWNRFQPSKYMTPVKSAEKGSFPTVLAVISHVLGSAPTSPLVLGFLNWLAYAFQYRTACGTAWMLQGVPGTGKGILANYIIKPLFGATNYTARRMEELEDKYNGYLEDCLICYVDEVHIGASKRSDIILANLKNQITEPSITIRNMRQMAYEVPNYLNWIMSSNMTTPIQLDKEDRRFNVGTYQTRSIRELFPDTALLVNLLATELGNFAGFLQNTVVDLGGVRTPIRNEARQDLIDNSKTSLDVVAEAMLTGNLELLASYASTEIDEMMQMRGDSYLALLKEIAKTGRNKLTRDEIRTIFLYTVGDVPATPAKFTRFLAHRGIKLKKIRVGDKTTMGIDLEWVISDALRQEVLTGQPPPYLTLTKPERDNDKPSETGTKFTTS